jgi:hypothetical protein
MLCRVALVRTDVSEELSASIIRVTRIDELGTVASYGYVPSSSILVTLMMEELSSSETSVITRATRHNIPEEAILPFIVKFNISESSFHETKSRNIVIRGRI